MNTLEHNLSFDEKIILIPEGNSCFLKFVLTVNTVVLLGIAIVIYFSQMGLNPQERYILIGAILAAIVFDSAFFVIALKQKYIITNKRIIRKCIIPPLGAELELTKVKELEISKTIFHRNDDVGNISCIHSGAEQFSISNIKNPIEVKATIDNLLKNDI